MACLTVPKLSYLGEHSEVSQARSLHACWTRMLYHDRLETIDNSQSTNSAKTLKVFNVYLPERFSWKNAGNSRFWTQTSRGRGIITTWHLLRSPRILCYIVDGSMLSILCVRLTIKVKVGIPESFKVGWYSPQKTGSRHLNPAPDWPPLGLRGCERTKTARGELPRGLVFSDAPQLRNA